MSTPSNKKRVDAIIQKDEGVATRDLATGEISEVTVVAQGEERTSIFIWLLVCVSSISGLLFGEHCITRMRILCDRL